MAGCGVGVEEVGAVRSQKERWSQRTRLYSPAWSSLVQAGGGGGGLSSSRTGESGPRRYWGAPPSQAKLVPPLHREEGALGAVWLFPPGYSRAERSTEVESALIQERRELGVAHFLPRPKLSDVTGGWVSFPHSPPLPFRQNQCFLPPSGHPCHRQPPGQLGSLEKMVEAPITEQTLCANFPPWSCVSLCGRLWRASSPAWRRVGLWRRMTAGRRRKAG